MRSQNLGIRRPSREALGARERHVELPDVTRKELITAAREAGQVLDLRPALRLVLGELVGCYGEQALARGLMIWPSNEYLCRKTGLAERTVRKCLHELGRLRLIVAVDSANRKRFAIRTRDGDIVDAYGFNLSTLYERRLEFAGLMIQQRLERERRGRLFDEITISRKAVEQTLSALADYYPEVPLQDLHVALARLVAATPRRTYGGPIEALVDEWNNLRQTVSDLFKEQSVPDPINKKESGYAGTECRHKESNNGRSTDTCKDFQGSNGAKTEAKVDLRLISAACPAAAAFGSSIGSPDDLIRAGEFLRSSIGAHPSAWREALDRIGPVSAAILVLIVLQLVEDDQNSGRYRIKNPGGLFRDLVRRRAENAYNIENELLALRKRHTG